MADKVNLTKSLKELEAIADWFEQQEAVDVEEGLTKVRQAAKLIKDSKARLALIENEFQEIEKEISDDVSDEPAETPPPPPVSKSTTTDGEKPVNLDDIPF